jgi:hypothetical protein
MRDDDEGGAVARLEEVHGDVGIRSGSPSHSR